MKKQILNIASVVKKNYFPERPSLAEIRLTNLTKSCDEYINKHAITPKMKILWPTLFNQDHTWWSHDGMLINALKVRGLDIIPTVCDQLQSQECMIYSGVWQRSTDPGFEERRKALCNQCRQADETLFKALNIQPMRLTSFVSEGEKKSIWQQAKTIMAGDWETAVVDGYPVGQEAWKAIVNNNLQGEIKPFWRKRADDQAIYHIYNILALKLAYNRIVEMIKPDRIVGNGGFYYQWGVLYDLCQALNIPYYRYYYIGLQPMAWNYERNTQALIHLAPAWSTWTKQPWSSNQVKKVKRDLMQRGMHVDIDQQPEIKARMNRIREELKLDSSKPVLLALSGIIWDANTNIESKAFKNMYHWIIDTIHWFAQHPEFQLVIRSHPSENIAPTIAPDERTTLFRELTLNNIIIPANVRLIKPEEKYDTYDLIHIADVGATYMSTTGLEFCCTGKPLLAVGPSHYSQKGFTFDPQTHEEYFNFVEKLMRNRRSIEDNSKSQELAMRYWYLFAFHASVVTGLFETHHKNMRTMKRGVDGFHSHIRAISVDDILPGVNPTLDYICNSIINNLPIMGENRWPPEVAEKYTLV